MKRLIDVFIASVGLMVFSPIIAIFMVLVWLQDLRSPLYIAPRSGRNGTTFDMIKLRSMVVDANKSGVDSTGANDPRITYIGTLIRKYKLDEITQLFNVLKGDMSLVGPRPNVEPETNLYTDVERELLSVRPGITDFASIDFSDEGEILVDELDPDLAYNQLIRPWKSRLGLVYIENQSVLLDVSLIIYTVVAIISKDTALRWGVGRLEKFGVDVTLVEVCKRAKPLYGFPPPGSDEIVTSRT